jgi:hypothetical protein
MITNQFSIVNGRVVMTSKQVVSIPYEATQLAYQIPARLAPSTSLVLPTYSSARILALYNDNAPAGYKGFYVNYDRNSTNLDQKIPSVIIVDAFLRGVLGMDLTNINTATQTVNSVQVYPLQLLTQLYWSVIEQYNEPSVVSGLLDYFIWKDIANTFYNDQPTTIKQIQGVK